MKTLFFLGTALFFAVFLSGCPQPPVCGNNLCETGEDIQGSPVYCEQDCHQTQDPQACSLDSDCKIDICAENSCVNKDYNPSNGSGCAFPPDKRADYCKCESNKCKGYKNSSDQCTDSDEGNKYFFVSGFAEKKSCNAELCLVERAEDNCDKKIVLEQYCENSNIKTAKVACENGCLNGACIASCGYGCAPPYCPDNTRMISFGWGVDGCCKPYFSCCGDGTCSYLETKESCPEDCSSIEKPLCLKREKNYFARHDALDLKNQKQYWDACIDAQCTDEECSATTSNTLQEYYCDGDKVRWETVNCENGCINGACIK